jgi:hypothetical protein
MASGIESLLGARKMEASTPVGERIERRHYGDRQFETAGTDESIRYGDPQHNVERANPDIVEGLRYEDRH